MKRACVVVLGEIGRSPRIRYHALSLAQFLKVHMIGYRGGADPSHPNLTISHLTPYPRSVRFALLNYLLKSIWQTVSLFLFMLSEDRYDFVLVQNPPAIPTLFICWFYCLIFKAKFIIDWHNYGHSIMALNHGKDSSIVKIATAIEYYFGRKADYNFCVSEAMKNDLLQNQNIQCKLLYDCPTRMFRPISVEEKHLFITKLSLQYPEFASTERTGDNSVNESTILTEKRPDGNITLRSKRPGILFSSTSWTLDEDFKILLDALEDYDKSCVETLKLPKLICVITGKGPMKDFYIQQILERKLRYVKIITPWLEIADYPRMVASADLGICLHTSSSGFDLPMKIIDMFGSGLPVCAYKYPCLSELVKECQNGYTFENSEELANRIKTWFLDFPNNHEQNEIAEKFKEELKTFQELNWEINWENRAKPYFL